RAVGSVGSASGSLLSLGPVSSLALGPSALLLPGPASPVPSPLLPSLPELPSPELPSPPLPPSPLPPPSACGLKNNAPLNPPECPCGAGDSEGRRERRKRPPAKSSPLSAATEWAVRIQAESATIETAECLFPIPVEFETR